ncbi:MAG: phosphocholine cytidylyltransferase family protein [bacterium]|nr:phosphocholine cytidylyltransferase family protein [bacterium]
MRTIILAAGRGSRLGLLTEDTPKPLLPVGEKTIIEHILNALHSCGVSDVVIVVGYKGDVIQSKIGDCYGNCHITYVYNDAYDHSDNLYSLWLARKYTASGMLFLNADTIFHSNILQYFMDSRYADAFLVDTKRKSEANPIVVHAKNNRLVEIGHTISREVHGIAPGIYKLSETTAPLYFKEAEKLFKNGPRNGGFVIPLQALASMVNLSPIHSDDQRWFNINTPDDYKKAQNLIKTLY